MELVSFIQNLLTDGKVSVKGALISFTDEDMQQTSALLRKYYLEDILEMPFTAPDFSPVAGIWAAQYFYQAVQLTVMRDADEETISSILKPFSENIAPQEIYSADLVLRYLPELFNLVEGLAPADMLVQELQKCALQWPFSSVGIALGGKANEEAIFAHPSLQQTYTDRIIKHKDKKRVTSTRIKASVSEAIGQYYTPVWPGIETTLQTSE